MCRRHQSINAAPGFELLEPRSLLSSTSVAATAAEVGSSIDQALQATPADTLEWQNRTPETVGMIERVHGRISYSTAVDPMGRFLVLSGQEGRARVLDAATGAILKDLPHPGFVKSVAVSPDGSRILTTCSDMTVRVWDVQSGHVVFQKPFEANTNMASFIFNEEFVVTVDGMGAVVINVNGAPQLVYGGWHIASVHAVKGRIATNHDRDILIYDKQAGNLLRVLPATSRPNAMQWSTDGTILWAGYDSGDLLGWDVLTGQIIATINGSAGSVESLAVGPDGTTVVVGYRGGSVVEWDVAAARTGNLREVHRMAIPGYADGLTLSPHGSRIFVNATVEQENTSHLYVFASVPMQLQAVTATTSANATEERVQKDAGTIDAVFSDPEAVAAVLMAIDEPVVEEDPTIRSEVTIAQRELLAHAGWGMGAAKALQMVETWERNIAMQLEEQQAVLAMMEVEEALVRARGPNYAGYNSFLYTIDRLRGDVAALQHRLTLFLQIRAGAGGVLNGTSEVDFPVGMIGLNRGMVLLAGAQSTQSQLTAFRRVGDEWQGMYRQMITFDSEGVGVFRFPLNETPIAGEYELRVEVRGDPSAVLQRISLRWEGPSAVLVPESFGMFAQKGEDFLVDPELRADVADAAQAMVDALDDTEQSLRGLLSVDSPALLLVQWQWHYQASSFVVDYREIWSRVQVQNQEWFPADPGAKVEAMFEADPNVRRGWYEEFIQSAQRQFEQRTRDGIGAYEGAMGEMLCTAVRMLLFRVTGNSEAARLLEEGLRRNHGVHQSAPGLQFLAGAGVQMPSVERIIAEAERQLTAPPASLLHLGKDQEALTRHNALLQAQTTTEFGPRTPEEQSLSRRALRTQRLIADASQSSRLLALREHYGAETYTAALAESPTSGETYATAGTVDSGSIDSPHIDLLQRWATVREEIGQIDSMELYTEVLGWYTDAAPARLVSIHSTNVRRDTAAGAIFLGFYQNAVALRNDVPSLMRMCAKVESVTGIPATNLFFLVADYDNEQFAESLMAEFRNDGFGSAFVEGEVEQAGIAPLLDPWALEHGIIRVRFNPPTLGSEVDHVGINLVNGDMLINAQENVVPYVQGKLYVEIPAALLGERKDVRIKVIVWCKDRDGNIDAENPVWGVTEIFDVKMESTQLLRGLSTATDTQRRDLENQILSHIQLPVTGDGWRRTIASPFHLYGNQNAVDLNWSSGNDDIGKEVIAVAPGTVVQNDTDGNGNSVLVIRHEANGIIWYSKYLHMQNITVRVGDQISQEVKIGEVGRVSSDPHMTAHLHLETYTEDGQLIDLGNFLDSRSIITKAWDGTGPEVEVEWNADVGHWMALEESAKGLTFVVDPNELTGGQNNVWVAWNADVNNRAVVVWEASKRIWLMFGDPAQRWDSKLQDFAPSGM